MRPLLGDLRGQAEWLQRRTITRALALFGQGSHCHGMLGFHSGGRESKPGVIFAWETQARALCKRAHLALKGEALWLGLAVHGLHDAAQDDLLAVRTTGKNIAWHSLDRWVLPLFSVPSKVNGAPVTFQWDQRSSGGSWRSPLLIPSCSGASAWRFWAKRDVVRQFLVTRVEGSTGELNCAHFFRVANPSFSKNFHVCQNLSGALGEKPHASRGFGRRGWRWIHPGNRGGKG